MIRHSMIVDDFYVDPCLVRNHILKTYMQDFINPADNVSYPGIVDIAEALQEDMNQKLNHLYKSVTINKMFARHSYFKMKPPHWAHSDFNMTQYVCLLYLSPVDYPWDGTHFVKHRETKMELHPTNEDEKYILLDEANYKSNWVITYTCPSRYNRAFIFDARYIHAAAYKFGDTRENSRLVLSTFFNLN